MLGRLEKVELREVWKHEALNFTNWLAREENINLLSDTIGIDIEIVGTEKSIGSFNVDMVAKDRSTDSKIIIENQLERTDHDHLGKIITYASGYDADTIIWLVKDVRDEHRKAVEWLNSHLDERINIFLIRIEVWKIGDSMPAPKFSIVESPNNWAKVFKDGFGGNKNIITDTQNLQLEFWTKLKEYGEDNYSNLRYQSPRPRHWYTFSAGSSQYNILVTVSPRDSLLRVILNIKESEELFLNFSNQKEDIESNLGFSLNWLELPDKKSFRIAIDKSININDRTTWEEAQKWALEKVKKMIEVFGEYR